MQKAKISKLKSILKDSEAKDPALVKKQAKKFLQTISAEELIQAEQEMIDEGIAPQAMSHLCAAHLELMENDLESFKNSLPDVHPLQTLVLEHEEILKFLSGLEEINFKIQKAEKIESLTKQTFEHLHHIIHHLEAAEKHHQREEDVLFPAAEAHGIYGPTQIMTQEHVEMRKIKKQLHLLVDKINGDNFEKFKKQFSNSSSELVQFLRDHIFKENNILYPAALDVIPKKEWVEIKKNADQIGYCCFTPGKANKPSTKSGATLDLRKIEPFARHDKIFALWEKIKNGESFKIINDHDPKPLHYQFAAEYPEQFEWKYIEQGPRDWIVIIEKI